MRHFHFFDELLDAFFASHCFGKFGLADFENFSLDVSLSVRFRTVALEHASFPRSVLDVKSVNDACDHDVEVFRRFAFFYEHALVEVDVESC